MKALILAAGVGRRMGGGGEQPPKSMVRLGDKSLLQRHLEILCRAGIEEIVIGVGYRAEMIRMEIERLGMEKNVITLFNPAYEEGSILTLWTLRESLGWGGDVLLMDADVLYDYRLMDRLLGSPHPNCFLLDKDLEPGDEPVKLCVRHGRLVEFRKQVDANLEYDFHGESVGFFRFSADIAARLAARAEDYIRWDLREAAYEEAMRDILLEDGGRSFGFEDITGLPWTEIDFPADLRRAEEWILPRLIDVSGVMDQS